MGSLDAQRPAPLKSGKAPPLTRVQKERKNRRKLRWVLQANPRGVALLTLHLPESGEIANYGQQPSIAKSGQQIPLHNQLSYGHEKCQGKWSFVWIRDSYVGHTTRASSSSQLFPQRDTGVFLLLLQLKMEKRLNDVPPVACARRAHRATNAVICSSPSS